MNLAAIRTAVQNLGYGTDTSTQQTYFVNAAYRSLLGGERWPFCEKQATLTLTIGANAQSYSTITDLLEFDAVRLADASGNLYNLENVEPQVMRDLETDCNDGTGTPEKWSLIANQLHFWPAPDQAYTAQIDYIYAPPDLVSDSDSPIIPTQFEDVLVFGTAKLVALRERDIWGSELFDNEYQTRLQKMRQSYLLRQRQTSSRVKKSGYWDTKRSTYPWSNW